MMMSIYIYIYDLLDHILFIFKLLNEPECICLRRLNCRVLRLSTFFHVDFKIKHLKKAEERISRKVVNITIKMKTIV